jgi:hypothetical protein
MLTSVELAHSEIAKKRLLRRHAEGSVKTMEVTNMVANVFCYDDEADEAEKMAAGAKEAIGEMAFANNTAMPRPMLAMIAASSPDQPATIDNIVSKQLVNLWALGQLSYIPPNVWTGRSQGWELSKPS